MCGQPRTAALLMYRHRYAREEGLGNVFIGKIDGRQTCVTLDLAAILLPYYCRVCMVWLLWW